MAETTDWREAAGVEYRAKRADALKRLSSAERAEQRAKERREEAERELRELDIGARAFGIDLLLKGDDGGVVVIQTKQPEVGSGTEPPAAEGQSARQIILMALERAYPNGLRASELRKVVERELGREVHYKTPGMTLYRLQEQEIVRRDGYDWSLAEAPPRWVPEPEPDPDDDDIESLVDWHLAQQQEDEMMDRK